MVAMSVSQPPTATHSQDAAGWVRVQRGAERERVSETGRNPSALLCHRKSTLRPCASQSAMTRRGGRRETACACPPAAPTPAEESIVTDTEAMGRPIRKAASIAHTAPHNSLAVELRRRA